MKLGIDKCGVLSMKRGKEVKCNGIGLKNGEKIVQIGGEWYKYFAVLEKGDICQEEIKESIRKEYFKRLREPLKSKLSIKHISQAINTWVVPTVCYSAGIIQ